MMTILYLSKVYVESFVHLMKIEKRYTANSFIYQVFVWDTEAAELG